MRSFTNARKKRVASLRGPSGCTAECSYTPVVATGTDEPVSIDVYTDQHTVGFVFPDRTHDYAVVVGGVSTGEHSSSEFYQFEVSGSNLPQ